MRPLEAPRGPAPPSPAPIARLDPGWLYLIAGVALLGATILLPAQHDLAQARHRRDAAMAEVARREERVARYQAYLKALQDKDPDLIRGLAAIHLNLLPEGVEPMPGSPALTLLDADPLPALEPAARRPPPMPTPRSRLETWALDHRTRLWLLAGGSLCMLLGLLPASTRGARRRERDGSGRTLRV